MPLPPVLLCGMVQTLSVDEPAADKWIESYAELRENGLTCYSDAGKANVHMKIDVDANTSVMTATRDKDGYRHARTLAATHAQTQQKKARKHEC